MRTNLHNILHKAILPSGFGRLWVAVLIFSVCGWHGAVAQLPAEPVPNVASLPSQLPNGWLFAHDVAFFNLSSGKVMLIDPASKTRNVRGMIGAAQFASFTQSRNGDELYVAESFFSRGTRGEQTDVLSIYNAHTLHHEGEVILPTGKRFQVVTHPSALQTTHDDKFILVFNFTPASSVTIIDRKKRKVVNEIDVPGCMLVYPQGRRGFATLCNDGSLLSIKLDNKGRQSKLARSRMFNDIDDNALFMKPAWIGKTAYLASYGGSIQALDLRSAKAKIPPAWDIPTAHAKALPNARPSGWQILAADRQGRLYVLMRANAGVGDHKWGGQAVYVLDAKTQRIVNILPLQTDGFSIQITNGKQQLLAVTNASMEIDIYDLKGRHQRTIGGWGPATPYTLYGVQ